MIIRIEELEIFLPFDGILDIEDRLTSFITSSKLLGYEVECREFLYNEETFSNIKFAFNPFKQIWVRNKDKRFTFNFHYNKDYNFKNVDMWENHKDNETDTHFWKVKDEQEIINGIEKLIKLL